MGFTARVMSIQGGENVRIDSQYTNLNTAAMSGSDSDAKISESSGKEKNQGENAGNVYGGNLNLGNSTIEQKKKQAQSMALQLMENVFERDSKMDADEVERTKHVKELKAENNEHQEILKDIEKERQRMEEEFNITKDGEEYKDLELLRKSRDCSKNPGMSLTEEEKQKVASLYAEGLSDYQKEMLKLDANEDEYRKKIEENNKKIVEENAIVRGMKIERLKTHDMVDAEKQGEQIKEAANKEIIGMLVEEVKENVDDKIEEEKQQAQEKKQEKEELEARIEAAREEKTGHKEDEHEEMYELDAILEDVKAVQNGSTLPDIKKSMNQIVNELKLTTEDLKGAVVDSEI